MTDSTIALIKRWRLDIQRYPYGDSTCTVQRSDDGEWCRYDEAVTELTTLLQRCEKAEADAKYRLDMWDATQTALNKVEADHLMVTELYNACSSDYTIAVTRAELAERERDEARKALEPFAKRADEWKHNSNTARVSVKLADLRAARNAMGEPKT